MLVNEIRLRDLVLAFAHVDGQRCADVEPLWIRHEKRSVDGAAGITRLGEVLAEPSAGSAGVLPHRLVECGGEVVAVRNGESALDGDRAQPLSDSVSMKSILFPGSVARALDAARARIVHRPGIPPFCLKRPGKRASVWS